MLEKANVTMGSQSVGTGEICREGLYYTVRCICTLPPGTLYKVYAVGETKQICLGTCLWKDGRFTLNKRISVREWGEKKRHLVVRRSESFIPILSTEPFSYLSHIWGNCLSVKEEQIGLILDSTEG